MWGAVAQLLAREQRAFLARDRRGWQEHLAKVRGFLGQGLAQADRSRPALVLGAGSGLEVPWAIAPPGTTGWDADPWSRARTCLRHRRWPPWEFGDMTGGLTELEALAHRCSRESWGRQRARPRAAARSRFLGLLPSLNPDPAALAAWIAAHRPTTILSANVLGQFGAVAQQLLGRHLGSWWEEPFPPRGPGRGAGIVDRPHPARPAGAAGPQWGGALAGLRPRGGPRNPGAVVGPLDRSLARADPGPGPRRAGGCPRRPRRGGGAGGAGSAGAPPGTLAVAAGAGPGARRRSAGVPS